MAQEVAAGRFREDLYYRLNVFPLRIPALRERPLDIAPLAQHLAARHGARLGRARCISAAAEAILAVQPWPGNVRELENVIQRALILASGDMIEPEHLQFSIVSPVAAASATTVSKVQPLSSPMAADQRVTRVKDLERQHILETLAAVGGSRKKAVERLGISERTLRYKLQRYRMASPQ
jgi:two-component system response regulator FlrC